MTSEPTINDIPDGVELAYADYPLWPVVQLRHFHRARAGDLTCELSAFCMEEGSMTQVAGVRLNLSSMPARKTMVKGLTESMVSGAVDWASIINDVCWRALLFYKNGQPVEEMWPSDDIPRPLYLLHPLLPLNQPTVIFGDGGSGKGHIAMTMGILASLPFTDNSLGISTMEEPTNCLYLDYESDANDFHRTLSGLCDGLGQSVGMRRMGMAIPLADCIEQVKNKVAECNITFVIVDSMGPAAGGNILEAEPAIKLYNAIRQLPVTTLIIAHNAKGGQDQKRSIFGSVFFSNLARGVWEVKKTQSEDSPIMTVSLTHTKYNRKRQMPLGLQFTFNENNSISVERCDLLDTEQANAYPLKYRLKKALERGALSVAELAEDLDEKEANIRTTLNREKTWFVRVAGDKWGLLTRA